MYIQLQLHHTIWDKYIHKETKRKGCQQCQFLPEPLHSFPARDHMSRHPFCKDSGYTIQYNRTCHKRYNQSILLRERQTNSGKHGYNLFHIIQVVTYFPIQTYICYYILFRLSLGCSMNFSLYKMYDQEILFNFLYFFVEVIAPYKHKAKIKISTTMTTIKFMIECTRYDGSNGYKIISMPSYTLYNIL